MGYYDTLTPEEEQKVQSVYAGAYLNKKMGQSYDRKEINNLFRQATGKNLGPEHMRSRPVIQLISLISLPKLGIGRKR